MRVFSWLYDRTLHWSAHPHAVRFLCILSAVESIFFPVPTDVMLAPMVLARPQRAWFLAGLATAFSVAGGVVGYALGWWAMYDWLFPILERWGWGPSIIHVESWFRDYGVWIVFVAGFSPIPYKVFTLTAGAMAMPVGPFVLASLLGRAGRFYLVAGLLRWGGEPFREKLRAWVDWIGWFLVLAVVCFLGYRALKA
jgi:membrane protein YqaA with SNARE-associated domain